MTGLSRTPVLGAPYLYDMTHLLSPDTPVLGRVESIRLLGKGSSHLSPRRWSIWFGGLARSPFLVGVAIAASMVFAACTSPGSDGSTTTVLTSPTSASTDPPSTSGSTSIPTTTTLPPDQDVIDAWSAYWDAWVEVRASDDLDPAPLEKVAVEGVVDGALALFERQRSSGLGPVQTQVVLHPSVTDSDPDRASVEDCVLLAPSFTDTTGVWYQADLSRTEQGWVVDAIRIPSSGGCVPKAMADAAISGYEAFYAAWADFWDPANPDSLLIGKVLAEPQRSLVVDLVADHQTRGAALRGQPTTHPEVIEVRSPDELVILSCLEPAAEYGLYDIDSGERLDDVPAVQDGQRNLESAVMVLENGLWKISDLQGQVDFACEFAPTDRGLPSV